METNKDIKFIQKCLIERLERLSDDSYMKDNLKDEISRSNAVANASLVYIKSESLKQKIYTSSKKERETFREISEL